MSSRNKGKEIAGEQIKDLAFTVKGHCMEDKLMDRETHEIITAYAKSSKLYKGMITGTRIVADEELFRYNMTYTDREMDEPSSGTQQYMVVGYTLRHWDPDIMKNAKNKAKQTRVGMTRPNEEDIITWDESAPPTFVVSDILAEKPQNVAYYALILPKNGLCAAYVVQQDTVFFRHEFRIKEASLVAKDSKSRISAWNDTVLSHSVRSGVEAIPSTLKEAKFRRAKYPAKLVFNPNKSIANEIAHLAANFHSCHEVWYLEEMLKVLEAAELDLKHRPSNLALRLFLEQEEELSEDQAEAVVERILDNWPELQHVSEEYVTELKSSLLRTGTSLEYRFLKPVLSEACWRMEKYDQGEATTGDRASFIDCMVGEVIGTAKRMLGSCEPTLPVSATNTTAIFTTLIVKLKEIVAAGEDIDEQLKKSCGDVSSDLTMSDIWAKYADSSDTDSTRACMMQVVRLVESGYRHKIWGVTERLNEVINVLEKHKLS